MAAAREEQSGRHVAEVRLQQEQSRGLSEGRCSGGGSLPLFFSFLILSYFEASVRRKQTRSSLLTGASTVLMPLPGVRARLIFMSATLAFPHVESIFGLFLQCIAKKH